MANWKEREYDKYSHDKWYQNTWFHYKTPIVAGIVIIAILSVLFFSSNMTDPTDIYILYITESPEIYKEKTDSLSEILTQYTKDANNDGKKIVYIENIYVGDEFDAANVYTNKEKIMTALRSGDCMFIISDEVGALYLEEAEACADLTDKLPENYDGTLEFEGRAWNWNDSSFKQSNEILTKTFGTSPLYFSLRVYEGTVAELTDHSKNNYEVAKSLFDSLVTNTKPE